MLPVSPTASEGTRRAEALRPLLASLGRELRERTQRLGVLLVELGRTPEDRRGQRDVLAAECADHRRALRRAHAELEQLRCQLVCTSPLVFCVDGGRGVESNVLFWCPD